MSMANEYVRHIMAMGAGSRTRALTYRSDSVGDNEVGWTSCLEYQKPIDYTVHSYFSSGGIHKDRRAITLNSIKFYDNEEEVYEGEAEDQKARLDTNAYRDFEGTATDLLHLGNADGVLLLDETKGL